MNNEVTTLTEKNNTLDKTHEFAISAKKIMKHKLTEEKISI